MNILLVATEAAPYLRTSDVASVVVDLGLQLIRQGHQARLVIPRYQSLVMPSDVEESTVLENMQVPLGGYDRKVRRVTRIHHRLGRDVLPIYLIDNPQVFGRANPYGYLDDYERFIFFTRAILEMIAAPGFANEGWLPDVIHGHDWAAGLIPLWLRYSYNNNPCLKNVAFVYTIHNAGFTGQYGSRALTIARLEETGIFTEIGENPNRINFMARGILAADKVNTVSPSHAVELRSGSYAPGLKLALDARHEEDPIQGILNGIDYTVYDPALDENVTEKFTPFRLSDRQVNKAALQELYGLDIDPNAPLIGMIGRLITEKGARLLEKKLPDLVEKEGAQVVVLGTSSDFRYRQAISEYAEHHPHQVAATFSYDEQRARQLYAGVDLLLVPSFHEPCGLQQMIAMRYGAVPVVHSTGGLADTVGPWSEESGKGWGFIFDDFHSEPFFQAVVEALQVYRTQKRTWQQIQKHNMAIDFSWEKSIHQYELLYGEAAARAARRAPIPEYPGDDFEPDLKDRLLGTILEANELSMVEDNDEYLKWAARQARELLNVDAVLVWVSSDINPDRLVLGEYSFQRDNGHSEVLEKDSYWIFAEQRSRSWSWQNVYRRQNGGGGKNLSYQYGYLGSELAKKYDWQVQLSLPISSPRTSVGQVDVFSRDGGREFTEWEISALEALANTIAVNLEKVQLRKLSSDLKLLSNALVAGGEMTSLVKSVVNTLARVLGVEASSLYLIDESGLLVIQAATGYQESLVERRASYKLGEGITGWIAEKGTPFRANSLEELHKHPTWKGKQNPGQGNREPESFLGLPLVVVDRVTGKDRVIGVLKVENIHSSSTHPDPNFTDQDELLVAMMANLIATVVYNTQFSNAQLQRFSANLSTLSSQALAGGLEMGSLVSRVVDTMATVLRAEASSLYLIDESGRLVIQAATGYQKDLVTKKVSYDIGEGITGWIAEKATPFRANSLDDLHRHPTWKGKQNANQNNREPKSFLGLPLVVKDRVTEEDRVIGVLKIENINASDAHPEEYFTDQDVLLVAMMANMIATVVYNTQVNTQANQSQLERFSNNLLTLSTQALAGGPEMSSLVSRVVDTMAAVLRAEASSLYLIDESGRLVIQAATGYQKDLVTKKVSYDIGEGITGWIAEKAMPFRANSLDDLHRHPTWKGKQNANQNNREPKSFLGLPLVVKDRMTGEDRVIGVLKIENINASGAHPEEYFTDQDLVLVTMMANVVATVVYNTQISQAQLQRFSENLSVLSTQALAGGPEMSSLVVRVVETISRVMGVEASSLYLLDQKTGRLVIQAAEGNQKALLEKGTSFQLGEGVTGWVAANKHFFMTNSLNELRGHPAWRGKQDAMQGSIEPYSYLAMPLLLSDRFSRQDRVIGVLNLENIRKSENHPEEFFTEQDILLVTMMAGVIAAVVDNTQTGKLQVDQLSDGIGKLVEAGVDQDGRAMMAGSAPDMLARMSGAMLAELADTLRAKAASLYLVDEATGRLVIQAATGYQAPLVEKRASYDFGEGLTGWIAKEKTMLVEDSLEHMRNHPAWKGKHDALLGGRTLDYSFLGMPLIGSGPRGEKRVVGVLKVEDLEISENHTAPYFSKQDILLVQRMAAVMMAIIEQFQRGESKVGDLLHLLGILTMPGQDTPAAILARYACGEDPGLADQLARAEAQFLDQNPAQAEKEAQALFENKAAAFVFGRIADWARDRRVKGRFGLFHAVLRSSLRFDTWDQVVQVTNPWLNLLRSETSPDTFTTSARQVMERIAQVLKVKINEDGLDASQSWYGCGLDTSSLLTRPADRVLVLFQRGGALDAENRSRVINFSQRGFRMAYPVVLIIQWSGGDLQDDIRELKAEVRDFYLNISGSSPVEIWSILNAPNPIDAFRSMVIRQISILSPFVITGPVPDNMFFGRENELAAIRNLLLNHKSCVITGGRRIGKTSVLMRLHRVLLQQDGFRSLFHDCSATPTPAAFLKARPIDWLPDAPQTANATFGELLDNPPDDKPLVLLLDEADRLAIPDHESGGTLLGRLRGLEASRKVYTVMCGESVLVELLLDPKLVTYNFAGEAHLRPLSEGALRRLITEPLASLAIDLVDEPKITRLIYTTTGGHPNVAQRLGKRLIDMVNDQNNRVIRPQDVENIVRSADFQESDFLNTYWERATPLEKIICLVLAPLAKPGKRWSLQEVLAELRTEGINPDPVVLERALRRLVDLRLILARVDTRYEFAFDGFIGVAAGITSRRDMLISECSEFARNPQELQR